MRKTLIGALASILLLAGLSGQAVAQDDSGTTGTEDTTQTDTTGTDTTQTDTTGTDTTQTDTTGTDTTQTDTTTTDTTTTDATPTPDPAPAVTAPASESGQGDPDIASAFAPDAANPQPAQPLTPEASAGPAPAADQVLGESQLAFTGPDTRTAALAMALLGAGTACAATSRRRTRQFEDC